MVIDTPSGKLTLTMHIEGDVDPEIERWVDCALMAATQCIEGGRLQPDLAIELATDLLARARYHSGDWCRECSGYGEKTYPSTATWTGGIGGQAMTAGVCDVCWGTGRKYKKGVNLRQVR